MKRANAPSASRRVLRAVFVALLGVAPGLTLAADPGPAPGPAAAPATTPSTTRAPATKKAPVALVDINSATKAQLKALPGIGETEAERIVAGRPYLSKADLASRKVIPTGVYLELKNRIIARQKQVAKRSN